MNFTLSIFGKSDAYIQLCNDWPCRYYYWIILGGWNNKYNTIRKCKDKCSESDEVHVKVVSLMKFTFE